MLNLLTLLFQLMNPPSVAAILPGTLVQATISAVLPYGLNLKFLGFFDGTADLYHIPLPQIHTASSGVGADLSKSFKAGKKVKARVLWNAPSMQTGGQVFALSLLPHVVSPTLPSTLSPEIIRQAFPPGRVLDAVSVLRVEPDFGLACSIAGPTPDDPPIPAFVHVRASQLPEETAELTHSAFSFLASLTSICSLFRQHQSGRPALFTAPALLASARLTACYSCLSSLPWWMLPSSTSRTCKLELKSRYKQHTDCVM